MRKLKNGNHLKLKTAQQLKSLTAKWQAYFNTVAHIIQQGVIDGLPDVAHRSLHVARGNDLVGPRCIFVGGENPDLSSGDFLLMNVHSLSRENRFLHNNCSVCSVNKHLNNKLKTSWRIHSIQNHAAIRSNNILIWTILTCQSIKVQS